jgi:hypothetical protein
MVDAGMRWVLITAPVRSSCAHARNHQRGGIPAAGARGQKRVFLATDPHRAPACLAIWARRPVEMRARGSGGESEGEAERLGET